MFGHLSRPKLCRAGEYLELNESDAESHVGRSFNDTLQPLSGFVLFCLAAQEQPTTPVTTRRGGGGSIAALHSSQSLLRSAEAVKRIDMYTHTTIPPSD